MFLSHLLQIINIVGSLRVREVACSVSDRQGSNFESCVWRAVSLHSSHHPQEVLLAQFILSWSVYADMLSALRIIPDITQAIFEGFYVSSLFSTNSMLLLSWASIADGGSILKQHLANISCYWDHPIGV